MSRGPIDITRTIALDTLTYPGDLPARLNTQRGQARGVHRWEITRIDASCHAGTHIDAPAHYIEGGRRLSDYPIEKLIMNALVVDTGDAESVQPGHLQGAEIPPDTAVLFSTSNRELSRTEFSREYCFISAEAAGLLAAAKPRLVGIDYLSVDPCDSTDYPAHAALLGAGILIMEDADLSHVQPGHYTLYCFPLRLHGTEAAPCRAVLMPR